MIPAVLNRKQLKEYVGISTETIRKMEHNGDFPRRRKISETRVGWLREEVDLWLKSREMSY